MNDLQLNAHIHFSVKSSIRSDHISIATPKFVKGISLLANLFMGRVQSTKLGDGDTVSLINPACSFFKLLCTVASGTNTNPQVDHSSCPNR
jgi:hypothetical protein